MKRKMERITELLNEANNLMEEMFDKSRNDLKERFFREREEDQWYDDFEFKNIDKEVYDFLESIDVFNQDDRYNSSEHYKFCQMVDREQELRDEKNAILQLENVLGIKIEKDKIDDIIAALNKLKEA